MSAALSPTPAPLLPLAASGADHSAERYLARVAARSKGGAEGKAVQEARRHLAHLAALACSVPAPAPRWPAGLPKLRPDLSRVPFSRLTSAIATELRARIFSAPNVAQGPRRHERERDGRGNGSALDPTPRPRRVRPKGHGSASVRVHHLRGVLRAAFESGAMDTQRYLACLAELRGA